MEYKITYDFNLFNSRASLGLAGTQMQTILANPLASPYTLGVSSAAGFGAAIAFISGFPFKKYLG